MTEKWIEDAIKAAQKDIDKFEPISERIFSLLDAFTQRMLDEWRTKIGEEQTFIFVHFMTTTPGASDSLFELVRCFFSVGYMFGKHDEETNYDYGNESEP